MVFSQCPSMQVLAQRIAKMRKQLLKPRTALKASDAQTDDLVFAMHDLEQVVDEASRGPGPTVPSLRMPAKPAPAEVVQAVEHAIEQHGTFQLDAVAATLKLQLPGLMFRLRIANPKTRRHSGHECTAKSLQTLTHMQLVATDGTGQEWIIDPCFRSQFSLPGCSTAYTEVLSQVPEVLIAPLDAVPDLVRQLANILAAETAAQGRSLAPWRSQTALLSKWQPSHYTDIPVTPSHLARSVSMPAARPACDPSTQHSDSVGGMCCSCSVTPASSNSSSQALTDWAPTPNSPLSTVDLHRTSTASTVAASDPARVVVGFTVAQTSRRADRPASEGTRSLRTCQSAPATLPTRPVQLPACLPFPPTVSVSAGAQVQRTAALAAAPTVTAAASQHTSSASAVPTDMAPVTTAAPPEADCDSRIEGGITRTLGSLKSLTTRDALLAAYKLLPKVHVVRRVGVQPAPSTAVFHTLPEGVLPLVQHTPWHHTAM